jgi:DedD protein
MDRALKERIIGAIVLVLFVVLVVPIFLDGPDNDGEIITEQVGLPGQSGEENRTIVLERDRTEPVPVAQQPAAETRQPAAQTTQATPPPSQVKTADATPVPKPQTTAAAASATTANTNTPVSTTGMWAVQMGSFSSQANAEKLAAELRKQGFAAFISQLSTASGELHRVRIGPQKDRESAEAMAERLRKAGHKGQVVPHP